MTGRGLDLLAGPRGRRLCLALALRSAGRGWPPRRWDGGVPRQAETDDVRRSLEAAVAGVDLSAVAGTTDPVAFLPALMESVDWARYWQEPEDADRLLAEPTLAAVLAPVAEAVVRSPAATWWSETLPPEDQHTIAWPSLDDPPVHRPPQGTGAPAALRRWRQDTLAEERRAVRERPDDPAAPWSGSWWSTPALAGLVVTSRSQPVGPGTPVRPAPVGLLLVEDESGWATARSWPVRAPGTARVLDLTGPDDWASLVERYPLEVTASRRHDWWRVTGWDGGWVVPDWPAVAGEYDAVHLTVDGYLSTAGRALPVEVPGVGGPARTLLGGWDPDATWWLTEVPLELGEPTDWRRRREEPPRWEPLH